MSIFEDWINTQNICDFYDLTIKENFEFVRVAPDEIKTNFPYLVSLTDQRVFYKPDYTGLKDDLQNWLNKKCYYQPPNTAVLMFKNKSDFMEFKLIYGGK